MFMYVHVENFSHVEKANVEMQDAKTVAVHYEFFDQFVQPLIAKCAKLISPVFFQLIL